MAGSYQIQTLEEPSGLILIGKDILPRNSAIGTKMFTGLKTDSDTKKKKKGITFSRSRVLNSLMTSSK